MAVNPNQAFLAENRKRLQQERGLVKDLPPVVSTPTPAPQGMQYVNGKLYEIPGYIAGPNGSDAQFSGSGTSFDYTSPNYGVTPTSSSAPLPGTTEPIDYNKIIQNMAEQGLISSQQALDIANKQLQQGQMSEAERVKKELDIQNKLLQTAFDPQRMEVEKGLQSAIGSANLGAAGRGSVRGSRQEQVILDLNDKATAAQNAINAQQQAQLRLYEAQLRGESKTITDSLQSAVDAANEKVKASQDTLSLAKQNALQQQIQLGQEKEAQQAALFETYLKETGQVLDPTTGQLIGSLSGKQKQAEIAKVILEGSLSQAKADEIYDKISRGNFEISTKDDEFGNTTAILFNRDTGATETLNLGKLGKTADLLLKQMYGGGGGSGSGGAFGSGAFDPAYAVIYEDIIKAKSSGDSEGYQSLLKTYQRKGYDASKLAIEADNYATYLIGQTPAPTATDSEQPSQFSQDVGKVAPGVLSTLETTPILNAPSLFSNFVNRGLNYFGL